MRRETPFSCPLCTDRKAATDDLASSDSCRALCHSCLFQAHLTKHVLCIPTGQPYAKYMSKVRVDSKSLYVLLVPVCRGWGAFSLCKVSHQPSRETWLNAFLFLFSMCGRAMHSCSISQVNASHCMTVVWTMHTWHHKSRHALHACQRRPTTHAESQSPASSPCPESTDNKRIAFSGHALTWT